MSTSPEDQITLDLIQEQINLLAIKSQETVLTLDEVKKLAMLNETRDRIRGGRTTTPQTINLIHNRPAKNINSDIILIELDRLASISATEYIEEPNND
jgi:uncharacterized protein YnzC (UPF0291/DUF896 family)